MYLSNEMKSITSIYRHGEITTLPFGKKGSIFKLFLQPKSGTSEVKSVIVDCSLLMDGSNSSGLPINPEQWTNEYASTVANTQANLSILEGYRVFWASGEEDPR